MKTRQTARKETGSYYIPTRNAQLAEISAAFDRCRNSAENAGYMAEPAKTLTQFFQLCWLV